MPQVVTAANDSIYGRVASRLSECDRKDLDAGIKEFNLKRHVYNRSLLPDELIHPRFANLARAVDRGIEAMIIAGRRAIQLDLKANQRIVPRWAQDHMEITAMETEHDLAEWRFESAKLRDDVPGTVEPPLV